MVPDAFWYISLAIEWWIRAEENTEVGRFAFNSDSDNEALTIPRKPINAIRRIVDNSSIGAAGGGKIDPNGLGSWGGCCCN